MDVDPPSPLPIPVDAGVRRIRGALVRGGAWNLAGKLTLLVAVFISTPFTVRLLGPVSYGAWSLLQYTVAYLVLADLGMSAASTKLAGDRQAVGDTNGEVSTVWTAAAMTTLATFVAAMALSIAAPFLAGGVLHIPTSLQGAMVVAIRVGALATLLRSISGTFNTPQTVRLRWTWVTLAVSGSAVLQAVAVPIVLVTIGHGLIALSGVLVAAALFSLAVNVVGAIRLQPSLRHPRIDRRLCGPLLRYGGALAVSGIASLPLTNAERFLLSHFHGTVPVAHYAVAASLSNLVIVLPMAITEPLFPALVRLNAGGGLSDASRLHHQALQGMVLVMTPLALLFGMVAEPFLNVWAGSEYARESTLPFLILLLGFWFNAMASIPYMRLLASGRTSSIAKLHLAELLPYLALAAVLTSVAGAIGAAIAYTARVVADSVFFFMRASQHSTPFRLPLPERRGRWMVMTTLLLAAEIASSRVASTLLPRLSLAAVLGIAYGLATWVWTLTSTEHQGIHGLVNELAGPLGRLGEQR